MAGLRQEWEERLSLLNNKKIVSIYFGGGTPALIGSKALREILSWIDAPGAEITLEANPEEITATELARFAKAGVNRVSFGVQSFNDELLKVLGRFHSAQQAVDAITMAADVGISNITIDLMYEVPQQTVDIWQATLDQVRQLPISHLSLYNLTFEPNTPFFKWRDTLKPMVPTETAALHMYEQAQKQLPAMGLHQYEISAFAKEGQHSVHNCGYWQARPFLGYGPSAFSYWQGRRFQNIANLHRYCQRLVQGESPVEFSEQLDPKASERERLAVELRLLEGVPLSRITSETSEEVETLISHGLLEKTNSFVRMTPRGIPLYDSIAAELV